MELPIVAWAAIYEEAARSLFGPLAINCMAPDDGNMNCCGWSARASRKKNGSGRSSKAKCARPS